MGLKEGEAQAETVVAKGCSVDGKITVDGPLRIDGNVTGKIQARGALLVAANARVVADVSAETIVVHGSIEGDLRASVAIELHPPAKVKGSIEAPAVVVERGAIFEGTCKMEPQAQSPVLVPAPAKRAVA